VVRKRGTLVEDYESTMAAITFAEAGAHDQAFQAMDRIAEPRKIVVVTTRESFASELIDYALELAERLGHEIVALSICTANAESARSANPKGAGEAAGDFGCRAAESVAGFRDGALRRSIAFQHLIREGSVRKVLEHLGSEVRRIDLVLTGADLSASNDFVDAGLPVFRVVPSRP
jgi:hypothetical protein